MKVQRVFRSAFAGVFVAAAAVALSLPATGVVQPAHAASIYDSGFERKIKMTRKQRSQVRRIMRKSNRRFNKIFRKYGIRKSATPKMSLLMEASGPLQSAARDERNALAKVFTPTQLQEYDKIIRKTEDKIVRAAK
jgi:uncharacterized membrane protein